MNPLLRNNATVQYKLNADNDIHTARLFKRSGKVSGKYKNEWNIIEENQLKVINFDTDVTELKVLEENIDTKDNSDSEEIVDDSESDSEETVFTETFITQAKSDVLDAKLRELKSW